MDQDNTSSAITILQEMQVAVPANLRPLPNDAMAPMEWSVLTIWDRRDDEREAINLRLQLILPSGRVAIQEGSTHDFEAFTKRFHRIVMTIHGMPVAETGELRLVLSLRDAVSDDYREVAAFPIRLGYVDAPGAAALSVPAGASNDA